LGGIIKIIMFLIDTDIIETKNQSIIKFIRVLLSQYTVIQ